MKRAAIKKFRDLVHQREILLKFARKLNQEGELIIREALFLAEFAHFGQSREEGDKYIIHPIRVANTIHRDLKIKDREMIVAALLHDVIEDSHLTSLQFIKNKFGVRVYGLVKRLTRVRPEQETEAHKRTWKAKKLKKYFNENVDTRLIKSADFLDNIRSWALIPKTSPAVKKFPRWLEETKNYYLPLAQKTNPYLAAEISEEFKNVKIISLLAKLPKL